MLEASSVLEYKTKELDFPNDNEGGDQKMIPTSEADRIPLYHQSFRSRAPFLTCSQRSETSDEFGGRRASEEEAVPMDESRTDAQLRTIRTDDKTVPGHGYPVRTW